MFSSRSTKQQTPPMRVSLLFGLILLVVAAAGASGQQQPSAAAQQQGAPPIVVRTPVVIVPVTVKDAHGQLVGDLAQDDFHILADNVEQKVASFSAEAVPLSAVVLLDNDLDQRVVSRVQNSLAAISAAFGPNDEVAFVAYDNLHATISDFSTNNDAFYTALTRFEIGSHDLTVYANPAFPVQGPPPGWVPPPNGLSDTRRGYIPPRFKTTVAVRDAIFAAGQMLRTRGRDRRKIIFLVSDEADSGNNAHGTEETLRSLLISDVSLYSISVGHPVPMGKKLLQRSKLMVEKLASDTGGDTYQAGDQLDIERLYSAVTEQARNEYTLTFSPEAVAKGQDFHPIEVRVKRPDLNVESRDGYYESAIAPGR
jgi:VWFA-related protein